MEDRYVVLAVHEGRMTVMPYDDGRGGQPIELVLDEESVAVDRAPAVASIMIEGDVGLVIDLADMERVRVLPGQDSVTFRRPGEGDDCAVATAEALHLADHGTLLPKLRSPAISDTIALLKDERTPVWIVPGGQRAWLDAQAARAAAEQRRKAYFARFRRLTEQRQTFDPDRDLGDGQFINPYTFVPLPERVERCRPRGHAGMGTDGLSGWVDVEWRFLSELLLPRDTPLGSRPRRVEVAGSAVKGAVRAVHEVLVDGCLRVFDPDLLPVHREQEVRHGDWVLAVVEAVTHDGRVTRVNPCTDVLWIDSTTLAASLGPGQAHSGMRIDIDADLTSTAAIWTRPGGQRVLKNGVPVRAGTTWVLHFTDGNARPQTEAYYAAAGLVGTGARDVESSAWREFQALAWDGADAVRARAQARVGENPPPDTHAAVPGGEGWPAVHVSFPRGSGTIVGVRRATDTWLGVGDTVWVDRGTGPVARLKPALLWRGRGQYPAGTRLGDRDLPPEQRLTACSDPEHLCPSCAVFGSSEVVRGSSQESNPAKQDPNRPRQRSYAAHVRFSPLQSPVPVEVEDRQLPPLSSPRPGSGMFYLSHEGISDEPDRLAPQPRPLSMWGSALDQGAEPRRLAGRKYYWHGVGPGPHPRHRRRPGNRDGVVTAGVVAPAGTVLTGRVWFDNLDACQLGMLLAAIEPGLLLQTVDGGRTSPDRRQVLTGRTFAHHLGGGRPLGYGSVTASVAGLTVHSAASRYGAPDTPTSTAADYIAVAKDAALAPHEDRVPVTWRALASVLDTERVPARRIWYPPNAPWSQRLRGTGSAGFNERFDESYRFFAVYRGGAGIGANSRQEPMEPLPDAIDAYQSLPVPGTRP